MDKETKEAVIKHTIYVIIIGAISFFIGEFVMGVKIAKEEKNEIKMYVDILREVNHISYNCAKEYHTEEFNIIGMDSKDFRALECYTYCTRCCDSISKMMMISISEYNWRRYLDEKLK